MQVLSLIRELSQKFNDHVSSSSPHTQLNSAISLLQEEIQALNSRTTESIHSQLEQLEAFSNNHDQGVKISHTKFLFGISIYISATQVFQSKRDYFIFATHILDWFSLYLFFFFFWYIFLYIQYIIE